jgi:hypothetical protein
MRALLQDL